MLVNDTDRRRFEFQLRGDIHLVLEIPDEVGATCSRTPDWQEILLSYFYAFK